MADDSSSGYRSSDPASRGPEGTGSATDPLAELARLIGQSNPASEYTAHSRATPLPRESAAPPRSEPSLPFGPDAFARPGGDSYYGSEPAPQRQALDPAPRYEPAPLPGFGREASRHAADPSPRPASESRYGADPAPRYGSDPAPRQGADRAARYDDPRADWPGSPAFPDPFAEPAQPRAADPFAELSSRLAHDISEQRGGSDRGFEPPGFAQDQDGRFPQPVYPQEPESGPMPSPHGDEFYDDEPRGKRRKSMLMVAAVLALAVVGTAGAFGYRSYFSGARSSAPPPVIRASGEPSKVAPPPAQPDSSASKFSYDRFGDRGKDEQVVVREEKPVDNRELARSSAVARATLPSAGASAQATAPSALGEPKRVRTLQIRPDQAEPSTTPQTVAAAPANPLAQAPVAPPPQPRANTRVASRPAPPPPEPAANAPLSLSPGGASPQPAPIVNSPPPRAAAPPPARVANAPAAVTGGTGGFLVQVSSQRSESEAETAFRSIQSRYTGVLGGQRHMVKRADLGSKGVYYRAMVGPFGTRDQAIQLCSSLKAAGGECVVQAN